MAKADLKILQGTWNIETLEMDGQSMPAGEAAITIQGSRFTTTAMGGEYSGEVAVDEKVSPKSFDLHFDSGPEKGNTSYGIYELDSDRWKICLTLRGGTRPKKFATKAGSGLALETLKRAAKATGKAKVAAAEVVGEPAPELAGEWSMVSVSMSGKPLNPEYVRVGRRIATASEMEVKVGPQSVMKASYAVDRSTSPMQMNYRLSNGREQAGIWKLEGRRLTTCFASPGQERPADYSSAAGDGRTLSVWEKQSVPRP
ncbi:MAG: hypothetical protein JWP63_50 [Candidatus Solibacter sp.]|nr:hypothetical protein [Candidatus Solibacter sp.]